MYVYEGEGTKFNNNAKCRGGDSVKHAIIADSRGRERDFDFFFFFLGCIYISWAALKTTSFHGFCVALTKIKKGKELHSQLLNVKVKKKTSTRWFFCAK